MPAILSEIAMTAVGEGLLTILAWLGFAASIGGAIYLAFLFLRRELPEVRGNDVEHNGGV